MRELQKRRQTKSVTFATGNETTLPTVSTGAPQRHETSAAKKTESQSKKVSFVEDLVTML
jgi:hypothetical protein